jgi:mannan endo-1,4-beta-mannosidase
MYGVGDFYTNPDAACLTLSHIICESLPTVISAFNRRITHTLNIHKNALLGNQPWNFLGAYIFGLEPKGAPELIFLTSG